tara:strand:+ start:24 stop:242 length:219 start_codon:yes stop_codon:yes gene_type:complete
MKMLETIEDIKKAVDDGRTVKCDNGNYTVVKDSGQYFITYDYSDYCIGLHGMEGTKFERNLNGENFREEQAS